MSRKTRKQKITAHNRRFKLNQPAVIESTASLSDTTTQPVVEVKKEDRQTLFIKKDLVKTVIITFLLILVELFLFKIRSS